MNFNTKKASRVQISDQQKWYFQVVDNSDVLSPSEVTDATIKVVYGNYLSGLAEKVKSENNGVLYSRDVYEQILVKIAKIYSKMNDLFFDFAGSPIFTIEQFLTSSFYNYLHRFFKFEVNKKRNPSKNIRFTLEYLKELLIVVQILPPILVTDLRKVTLDNLYSYIKGVDFQNLLDSAEPYFSVLLEEALQEREKYREILTISNQRLIISVSAKYSNKTNIFMDLVQSGNVGLLKAINRYEPWRGYKFSTYAMYWIHNEINIGYKDITRPIKLSNYKLGELRNLLAIKQTLEDKYYRTVTENELAKYVKKPVEEVKSLLNMLYKFDMVSLDVTLSASSQNSATFLDLVDNEEQGIQGLIDQLHNKQVVGEILQDLPYMERQVILHRFGFIRGNSYTLTEISNTFNISVETARRYEVRALKKLRTPARMKKLKNKLYGL